MLLPISFAMAEDLSDNASASASLSEANLQSLSAADEENQNPSEEFTTEDTEDEAPALDLQLYQANVTVTDSSETERDKAFPELLQKVLIKISANPKVGELPIIKPALKNAESFVEQFSYTHGNSLQLNAHFNADSVNALLVKAGQPVLNQQRPLVVVWLIIHETDGNNHLVGTLSEDTIGQDWAKTMHESADAIILPIVFPFGDLDDLSAISSDDLWTITPEKLRQASERYNTQDILVIKMSSKQTDPCISQWSFLSDDEDTFQETSNWKESAPTCQEALQKGLIQTLHRLFSPKTEKKPTENNEPPAVIEPIQTIHLSITHIQSAEDYQQVLNDLQEQPGIVDVEIEKVTPASVSYVLHVKGGLIHVVDILSNHPEIQFLQKNDRDNSLEYTFIGRASSNVWEVQQ